MKNRYIDSYLKKQKNKIKKRDFFKKYIISILFLFIITNFILGIAIVSGNSMYPTINDKDIIVYSRLYNNYKNGDIVIIKDDIRNNYYIKRIIGTEGDYINIDEKKRRIIRNNVIIEEKYIKEYITDKHDLDFPIIVSKNRVFILGDNREVSKDSRCSEIGMIESENILGAVICLIRITI